MDKIRSIMEHEAYICYEDETIKEVLEYLLEMKVSGVPVVDHQMRVKGFISDGDIMGYVSRKKPILLGGFLDTSFSVVDDESFENKLEALMSMTAMDLAAKNVITVDVDCPIDEVADILSKRKIKKVPVLSDGKLAGVVSRSTILRYMADCMLRRYENI